LASLVCRLSGVQGAELHQTLQEMKAADDTKYTKSHKKFRFKYNMIIAIYSKAILLAPAYVARASRAHLTAPFCYCRFFDADGSDFVTRDEFEAGLPPCLPQSA
jgi:hypothetical protein